MRVPTDQEIIQIDDQLAAEGVAIDDRANQALQRWLKRTDWSGEFIPIAKHFEECFRKLHPSVKLHGRPFMFLCASARGVAYEYHPPVIFGSVRIDPIDQLQISKGELQRIWDSDQDAYWELFYQCCDCFDLFLVQMDMPIKDADAAGYAAAARDQLQASARQLVAAASDSSLAQACCLAAELAGKAALRERGVVDVKFLGHRIADIYAELVTRSPAATDTDVLAVSKLMPSYVEVRYSPPSLPPKKAQALYAKTMFLCADAFRREARQSMYLGIMGDSSVPKRKWQ